MLIKPDDSVPFDSLPPIAPPQDRLAAMQCDPLAPAHVPAGMKVLPSGLAVPTEAAMKREVWMHDEAKKFRRFLNFLEEKKIGLLLKCGHCNSLLSITKQLDGTYTLDCDCTYRELRR
jgi:hypothetical protein